MIDALVDLANHMPQCECMEGRKIALNALYKEAERLAGRAVEVERTTDGKCIVLWMSFGTSPPPKSDSEPEALGAFIKMMLQRNGADTNLPEVEDTDGEHS